MITEPHYVQLGWMAALRVLKQELIRTQAVSDVQGANNLQADITTLTAVIHRLGDVFPIIGQFYPCSLANRWVLIVCLLDVAIEFGRVEQSA